VTATDAGIRLNYVTNKNVGSRLYLLDGEKYKMFHMLNKEITIGYDVSTLECGLNGAVYFVEMDETGDQSGANKAGAKFGTGYCDGQCARDVKFVKGKANNQDWIPNPKDPFHNTGKGSLGACCAEMDLWEANKISTAFTAHPAPTPAAPTPKPEPTPFPTPVPTPAPSPVGVGQCCYGASGATCASMSSCQGGWCGQSQAHCEGGCNGKWCPKLAEIVV